MAKEICVIFNRYSSIILIPIMPTLKEFYLHLLTVMERENRKIGKTNQAFQSLQFKVEDRLECGSSKQVMW